MNANADIYISKYKLYNYILPVLNSNMFMLVGDSSALLIDPIKSPEAEGLLEKKGTKELLILLTHEHYDHISGVNRWREWLSGITGHGKCFVFGSEKCRELAGSPRGNLSEYFMALVISKSPEEQALAERIFEKDYSCSVDRVFSGEYDFRWEDLRIFMKEMPGHSPGSICLEFYTANECGQPDQGRHAKDDNHDNPSAEPRYAKGLLALATGDSLVQGHKVITRVPGGNRKLYQSSVRPYLESFSPETLILPGHGKPGLLQDMELG